MPSYYHAKFQKNHAWAEMKDALSTNFSFPAKSSYSLHPIKVKLYK